MGKGYVHFLKNHSRKKKKKKFSENWNAPAGSFPQKKKLSGNWNAPAGSFDGVGLCVGSCRVNLNSIT